MQLGTAYAALLSALLCMHAVALTKATCASVCTNSGKEQDVKTTVTALTQCRQGDAGPGAMWKVGLTQASLHETPKQHSELCFGFAFQHVWKQTFSVCAALYMVSLDRIILMATSVPGTGLCLSLARRTELKTPLPCVANTSYLPSMISPTCSTVGHCIRVYPSHKHSAFAMVQ